MNRRSWLTNNYEQLVTDDREIAVGGDGKTPILDSVTGEPIRVPPLDFDPGSFDNAVRGVETRERETVPESRQERVAAYRSQRLLRIRVGSSLPMFWRFIQWVGREMNVLTGEWEDVVLCEYDPEYDPEWSE